MRINVYRTNERGLKMLDGWFETEVSTRYQGCLDPSSGFCECLYRTQSGRWVLNFGQDWRFVPDVSAVNWLTANQFKEAVQQWFGEGRRRGVPGRPEIGSPINIRLGGELLRSLDAYAQETGQTRASLIRQAVSELLSHAQPPALAG